MSRPKGVHNKPNPLPWPMNLTAKGRIELLANLIVDRIIEDQKNGAPLLKKIEAEQRSTIKQNQ